LGGVLSAAEHTVEHLDGEPPLHPIAELPDPAFMEVILLGEDRSAACEEQMAFVVKKHLSIPCILFAPTGSHL
jgi:hypothetical protein